MPFSTKVIAFGTLLVFAGWPQHPQAQPAAAFEVVFGSRTEPFDIAAQASAGVPTAFPGRGAALPRMTC